MVRSKRAGFTLIEIVLVLAIAGLILAMIIATLPQAERGRRDTQRKNDLARMQTQIEFYGSNHSGKYPNNIRTDADFWNSGASPIGSYVPSNFNDPSDGKNYFKETSGNPGHIDYQLGPGALTGCNGVALSNNRQFVLNMQLEAGTACLDNL